MTRRVDILGTLAIRWDEILRMASVMEAFLIKVAPDIPVLDTRALDIPVLDIRALDIRGWGIPVLVPPVLVPPVLALQVRAGADIPTTVGEMVLAALHPGCHFGSRNTR